METLIYREIFQLARAFLEELKGNGKVIDGLAQHSSKG